MRLLIVTQVVDTEDPVLGFFVRWIEEFSKHCEKITVVCLRKGKYAFPKHVEVISLGEGHRVRRAFELCSISVGRRNEYDAVFAHMSPEFAVAAGWLWRLMGKSVGLWYTHKSVTMWLRIAVFLSHYVFTASKESFRLLSSKLIVTGHGIDTDFFAPNPNIARRDYLVSVGRLSKSKRHELGIEAAVLAAREIKVIGEGPEEEALKDRARELHARVEFLGGVPQQEVRDIYTKAIALVHTSETGSLDKVVLEALATNLPVVSTSEAMCDLPVTYSHDTPEAIARALTEATMPRERRGMIVSKHSLSSTVGVILKQYE